ncbi:MAG: prepilin-type N-terminal cleavage/methylation domain-containing protein [Planctomycetes bacterium]|nr:prepilin-type N-terminal cleavage/methylation domain-containing protein [Planctomycetota bacterium]
MNRIAFTLIELLVVIAVIAVLMGVLVPALRSAREQANFLVCRANLRSHGLAGSLYMAENDQRFPSAQTWLYNIPGEPVIVAHPCRWHDPRVEADGSLWPYLGDMDCHMCPTFHLLSRSICADHPGHDVRIPIDPQFSYSMNHFLGENHPDMWNKPAFIRKITQLKNPGDVLFFSEENCWTIPGVSTLPLNNNILAIRQTPFNNIATYHKTKGSDLNSGVANVVFVDGHVDSALAENSWEIAFPRR